MQIENIKKSLSFSHVVRYVILIAFFISTLYLVLGTPTVFNSPDENSAFVFSKTFIETGRFIIDEGYNSLVSGVIGPRSTAVILNGLAPMSFLGLPLVYGLVGKITGINFILFITPILAVLTIIAWHSIIKRWFNNTKLADIASFFLMIHPAFWLYTGRTMMHNVAFLSFLVFSVWVLSRKISSRNLFIAGLLVGLAIAFRTSEIFWIGILSFFVGYKILLFSKSYLKVLLFFLGIVLMVMPFAFLNKQIYGGYFTTGYTVANPFSITVDNDNTSDILENTKKINFDVVKYIVPFGIHEKAIVRNVYYYGFWLYPWISGLALFGILLILKDWKKLKNKNWHIAVFVTLFLSVWLGVVYGSWRFTDNPDLSLITLGNSYTRYWLPLFLLSSLFVGKAVIFLSERIKKPILRRYFIVFVLLGSALLSFNLVFFGNDGFVQTGKNIDSFIEKRDNILSLTEENSVIIVDMADKYLFPYRKVVVPLREESTYQAMPRIVDISPLYYFGITLPEKDLNYLNKRKLKNLGLHIVKIKTISEETLYKISKDVN